MRWRNAFRSFRLAGSSHPEWVDRVGIDVEMRSLGFSGAMTVSMVGDRSAKINNRSPKGVLAFLSMLVPVYDPRKTKTDASSMDEWGSIVLISVSG